MDGHVTPELSKRQPSAPIAWFITSKATKVAFQTLVDNFGLAIALRMVRRAKVQLCMLQREKFKQKM